MNNKIVLDIGANIGAFTYYCLKHKVKKVYCFEPEPGNIAMFENNIKDPRVKLYKRAVYNTNSKINLYVNTKGKNKGLHTVRKTRGRDIIQVQAIAFKDILTKLNPDIVKIDIEGGEYYLDFNLLLDSNVEYLAVEIHLTQSEHYESGIKLIRFLQKHFIALNKPIDTSGKITSWTKVFLGKRKG